MEWRASILQSILLVAALSVDAFVASFAYGTDKIRIPPFSGFVICAICSGLLGISLAVGRLLGPALPDALTGILGFSLLFLLGIIKLFDSWLKNFLRRHQSGKKRLHFCLAGLRFILQVYVDSTAADRDASRLLSPGEAASLAFALSVDGLAVGFGAGLLEGDPLMLMLLSLLTTAAAILTGGAIGRRIAERLKMDLGWLSGLLLMLLAVLKLF